jgi:iron complex transport system substrate-binding protein
MKFDLLDADGRELEHQRHLLSLRDMNQLQHLEELIAAGACSFKIEGRLKDVKEEERKKVLFLFQYDENTMITSGSSFFGQWWCDASGTINAAHDVAADNSNAKITMEQVYKWDPDVIIITNFTGTQPEDIYNNAIGDDDWSGVKAVKEKRVYKMPMGSYRSYTPGVDTPMTLQWLAQAVYPEIFPDYDVKEKVKDYYKTIYGVTLTDEQVNRMYTPNRDAGKMN